MATPKHCASTRFDKSRLEELIAVARGSAIRPGKIWSCCGGRTGGGSGRLQKRARGCGDDEFKVVLRDLDTSGRDDLYAGFPERCGHQEGPISGSRPGGYGDPGIRQGGCRGMARPIRVCAASASKKSSTSPKRPAIITCSADGPLHAAV